MSCFPKTGIYETIDFCKPSLDCLVNLLSVRLRAEHWFKEFPEILDQEVHPPMVIVGLDFGRNLADFEPVFVFTARNVRPD